METSTNLILISTFALAFYNVLIKQFPDKLLLLFWINLFYSIGFIGIFFFQREVLAHDTHVFQYLVAIVTDDAVLYLAIALSFLGAMITLDKLLSGYDLSVVYPMSQLSILLASAGYLALGEPFRWSMLIGLVILSIGAFATSLSVTDKASATSLFAQFRQVSGRLWLLAGAQALCSTTSLLIAYLGTRETAHTTIILHDLRSLHLGPVMFHSAFDFHIGQKFFSILIFAGYLLYRQKYRAKIFVPLTNHPKHLMLAALAYLIMMYAYLGAFALGTNTTILLALNNLAILITLLFSFLFLKEHIGATKVVGALLILLGGLLTVLP